MFDKMTQRLTRSLKLGISFLYWCLSVLKEAVMRFTGRPYKGDCIILYYHAITAAQRKRFATQMDIALKWSSPIAAGRRQAVRLGKASFAVTFDDAFQCVAENALPELQRREIPSTIFVVTKSLDEYPIWLNQAHRTSGTNKVMSAETLKKCMSGLVAIGSHSLTHPNLCQLEEAEARRQINASRTELEMLLHAPVTLFSFPYGAYDEKLIRSCRDAGYQRVFTTLPRPALSDPEEFVCGRIVADPADWPLEFFLKIQGAYSWLPWAFSLKRKLKLAFRAGNREHPD